MVLICKTNGFILAKIRTSYSVHTLNNEEVLLQVITYLLLTTKCKSKQKFLLVSCSKSLQN